MQSSLSSLVPMRRKGHLDHLCGQRLAANHEAKLRAGSCEFASHIAHCDRPVHGRAEAARCDLADLAPVRRGDRRTLARRRAALGLEPDADTRRAVLDLAPDTLGAGETALLAPALLDRPCQPCLDGRGPDVDVMAVEAQPRLEP